MGEHPGGLLVVGGGEDGVRPGAADRQEFGEERGATGTGGRPRAAPRSGRGAARVRAARCAAGTSPAARPRRATPRGGRRSAGARRGRVRRGAAGRVVAVEGGAGLGGESGVSSTARMPEPTLVPRGQGARCAVSGSRVRVAWRRPSWSRTREVARTTTLSRRPSARARRIGSTSCRPSGSWALSRRSRGLPTRLPRRSPV
ncbi:hypothetical protein O1L60_16245 [Streptomyces diastatochromogenes]|nr:hypothetical protein [Streptomyces diastatochromogenes]